MARKEEYDFYKSIGVCVDCKNEPAYGKQVVCVVCAVKRQDTQHKYYLAHKEAIRARENEQKRIKYKERKEKELCPKCGKKKVTPGYKTCTLCRYKNTEIAGILRYTGKRR